MTTPRAIRFSIHPSRLAAFARTTAILATVALVAGGCSSGPITYEPLELREIQPADEVEYDVTYRPGVREAEESHVLRDVEDLNPTDGVFRVDAGSPLLDGVAPGDVVVWPQIGFLQIQGLEDQGPVVEVEATYARFGDAVSEGQIHFRHALTSGDPGRAVGVVAGEMIPADADGAVTQALSLPGVPVDYTEDGLGYEGSVEPYGLDYDLRIGGDSMRVQLSASSGSVTATVTGTVSGLDAEGFVFMDPEDDDPSVVVQFENITVDVDVTLEVDGASGSATLIPPAQLTFPFTVGPIPAYISVGTRMQVRSSISRGDTIMSTSAGFTMQGAVAVARNDDGGFGAEGEMTRFEGRSPSHSFQTINTAGVGIDVDAPRVSLGIGRPSIAAASIFGTHSAEIFANVDVAPEEQYCATVGTGGAIQVGGELNFFGWSFGGDPVPIAVYEGDRAATGPLCN